MLTAVEHNEFFVQLLGWYENKKSIFLSMEYFQLGDLADCLASPAPEQHAKVIASQLLEGLLIMHDLGFTHRDLKPKVHSRSIEIRTNTDEQTEHLRRFTRA
jgi:serine/threonine protein kinase